MLLKFYPFLLVFAPLLVNAREIDRTAVLVNGDVILQSDISEFRKNFPLRREIDPLVQLLGFSLDSAKEAEVKNYLIQEVLVKQKYAASEDEIEEEINAVQRNNRIEIGRAHV